METLREAYALARKNNGAPGTVRDRFARDLSESRSARRAREREEFTEIRATLDAGRLLTALTHSHGQILERIRSVKARMAATESGPVRAI
jgi:hypothetical protein